ncbi:MAG: type II toxin-antitoxin system VapC family toxin [Candidatus Aenigmarchaeota archaeon]|nr:type II toxin-antitoxin system VapC family toxin [Candidatus Aenigmarchaeota archaeon]
MKYCADTWFFIQLTNRHPKAVDIWSEIKSGKGRLVVSTVVIAEAVKEILKNNLFRDLGDFLHAFSVSENITVIDVTKEIATDGGKYSFSQNMTTIDGIIQATAIKTDHINILSRDEHYKKAEKQGLIKRVFW